MTRSVMSKKAMEWICFCLKEASKEHKKEARRWKLARKRAELFWWKVGLNHTELALNAGWVDIALKIERFIKSQQREKEHSFSRVTEDEYSYLRLSASKWGADIALQARRRNQRGGYRELVLNNRKKAFRVNIYELNSEMFLFNSQQIHGGIDHPRPMEVEE
ncbi:hypothetical protein H5410_027327 [Solanum commersonii]|uniref:Uncharacterized protein n=1 Tax=Solanum commersonii TaxID=4109 RepID=A0A9J5YYT0_SOLCO|nr:hypothetical protein H5410_027327 [Solanum commersonii]